jgi:hypothetical protein
MKTTSDVIASASVHLKELSGHIFDLLTVSKPISPEAAVNLAKIVSKLSPLLGNLIEFNCVEFLNDQEEYKGLGDWERQDPGFPDTIFSGSIQPTPGFEIKAWFPLATEITARFKDSQNHFRDDQTYVCLLAWLPDKLIFGKPKIVDVCVVSGMSVAKARDNHYHNPPDYLVMEPEDTTARTRNLQQTNTNGYKWQGTPEQFIEAQTLVNSWEGNGLPYQPTPEYQTKLRELMAKYPYRLDTNFAKMNRINHDEINEFKQKVLDSEHHGMKIKRWARLLSQGNEATLEKALKDQLGIIEVDSESLLQ